MASIPTPQQVLTDRAYPRSREHLPTETLEGRRYVARFADSRADLEAIQRLRFEVFNLELEEGLEESFATGLDPGSTRIFDFLKRDLSGPVPLLVTYAMPVPIARKRAVSGKFNHAEPRRARPPLRPSRVVSSRCTMS